MKETKETNTDETAVVASIYAAAKYFMFFAHFLYTSYTVLVMTSLCRTQNNCYSYVASKNHCKVFEFKQTRF